MVYPLVNQRTLQKPYNLLRPSGAKATEVGVKRNQDQINDNVTFGCQEENSVAAKRIVAKGGEISKQIVINK